MGREGVLDGATEGLIGGRQSTPTLKRYEFDTGLGKTQRAIVQDAVVEMLSRLLVSEGGYLNAIEPTSALIAGKHDEDGLGLVYEQLQGREPAIAIATGAKRYDPAGLDFNFKSDLDVHVYILCKSLRSRMARVEGDLESDATPTADPGVYVIMEHVEQLLIGQRPGGNLGSIKELRPVEESQLGTAADFEIWHQRYQVFCQRTIDKKRDLTQQLKQINAYGRIATQADTDTPITSTETVVKP